MRRLLIFFFILLLVVPVEAGMFDAGDDVFGNTDIKANEKDISLIASTGLKAMDDDISIRYELFYDIDKNLFFYRGQGRFKRDSKYNPSVRLILYGVIDPVSKTLTFAWSNPDRNKVYVNPFDLHAKGATGIYDDFKANYDASPWLNDTVPLSRNKSELDESNPYHRKIADQLLPLKYGRQGSYNINFFKITSDDIIQSLQFHQELSRQINCIDQEKRSAASLTNKSLDARCKNFRRDITILMLRMIFPDPKMLKRVPQSKQFDAAKYLEKVRQPGELKSLLLNGIFSVDSAAVRQSLDNPAIESMLRVFALKFRDDDSLMSLFEDAPVQAKASENIVVSMPGETDRIKYLPTGGYYVTVSPTDDRVWKVDDISTSLTPRQNEKQERIYIQPDFVAAWPAFDNNLRTGSHNITRKAWECTPLMHKSNRQGYNACTSKLTKTAVGKTIGKNAFAVLSLGLAAGHWQELDKDLIKKIIVDNHLVEKINELSGAQPFPAGRTYTADYNINGYQLTVNTVLRIKSDAKVIISACDDYASAGGAFNLRESAKMLPYVDTRNSLNNAFATKYPGSNFDCVDKSGRVHVAAREYVYQSGKLVSYRENVTLSFEMMILEGGNFALVTLSDSIQRQMISLMVDIFKPEKSYFNNASLTTTASTSYQAPANKMSIEQNRLMSILDKAYKEKAASGVTMLDFAESVLLQPEIRDKMVLLSQSEGAGK